MSGSNRDISSQIEFHDQCAQNWTEGYERYGFKRRLKFITSIINHSVKEGETWLDLGCGSGVLTDQLMKRAAVVVGVDKSPLMLSMAASKLDSNCVSFVQGDAHDSTWSESRVFDGVLSSSVIEYLDDPDQVIRQISRVLKDDGLLIISIPNKQSFIRKFQKVLRFLLKLYGKDKFAYLDFSRFEIEPSFVKEWLKQANLLLISCSGFDPLIPRSLFLIFQPSLLICEAKKFKNSAHCDLK